MFCYHCGKELPDNARFCPGCGTQAADDNLQHMDYQSYNQMYRDNGSYQPYGVQTKPRGMRWYKFVIYVQLFLTAILSGVQGLMFLTGNISGIDRASLEAIYLFYPSLKTLFIVIGIAELVIAVFAIVVRMHLAQFRVGAPMKYYALISANIAVLLVMMIGGKAILGVSPMDDSTSMINLVVLIVLLILNIVYFGHRKDLFVN